MIVQNLRASREDIDVKQKDVAKFFKLHYSTISGWETGKDTIPIEKLIEYANQYSISLDYLFGIISRNQKYYSFDLDLELLAKNLTELRLKNNLTQEYVAKKLNTTQAAYSHYENALNIIPTSFLFGLTKIYKPFSIDKLFGRKRIIP